jgi:hypothetical protein
MKLLFALAIAGLVLSGCAVNVDRPTPGQYSDYREMAYDESKAMNIEGVPEELKRKLQICTVDTTMDFMTPSEIQWVNAYARGEVDIRRSDYRSFEDSLIDRMGGRDGTLKAMAKKCPVVMAELSKYKA